jgi:glutamyl-tRNA synthetase
MRAGLSKDLIARVLRGKPKYAISELEEKFPPRNLHVGAMVTRFAPSPTGFVHIGNIYGMLIDKMLAYQSGGVFYLRVEDTDTARTVAGGAEVINTVAEKLGLATDEGPVQGGEYGPYRQSERGDIYYSVIAELLAGGQVYPCFLTQAEIDEVRETQEQSRIPTGIYGEYARDRDLSEEEISAHLNNGEIPSIRWRSTGDESRKIIVKDAARGSIAIPEWNKDEVLIKSGDGLPTYHFAHLVDDHFMRTTLVVRDESWLGTAALHAMLFSMMGWDAPLYYHTPTLDKIDGETGNRRKLSKRKDPEFSVANWWKEGWPADAILEYLFNLIASGYEEEKLKKPGASIWSYPIKIKKMPTSGALFDIKKLEWWSREFIATLTVDELVRRVADWADEYSPEWAARIKDNKEYLSKILAIERDNPKRIRKDFITWKQTLEEVSYFWDDLFAPSMEFEFNKNALDAFLSGFDANDDKDVWWGKIVDLAAGSGLKNGDAAMNLRAALTGRTNTPDLYSIMRTMGEDRVRRRIALAAGLGNL